MIPQKEDIGRQVKEKALPSKEIIRPGQDNPLVILYSWWKSQPDKGLLLFCGSLFTILFCFGHYFFNPLLKPRDYSYFGYVPMVFLFMISLGRPATILGLIVYLSISVFGAIPLVPFSFVIGAKHTSEETYRSFSRITYLVASFYFPSLTSYRWLMYCIFHPIPFTALFGFLTISIDTFLSLSLPQLCVLYLYNRFFFGVGRKIKHEKSK